MILLRSLLFNIVFYGSTFLIVLPATVVRLISPAGVMPLARFWTRFVLANLRLICRIRIQIDGLDNLPAGPALIASRHESAFDTLLWPTLAPRFCFVLKQELLRIPLFGKLLLATGMIAIDRDGGGATIRSMVRQAEQAVKDGRQIVIFPEGTRAPPGVLLPLHPGVAALASRTGLPVIPVETDSGTLWGRESFLKRPGVIRVVIHPPLGTDLGRIELMRQLEAALSKTLKARRAAPMPSEES